MLIMVSIWSNVLNHFWCKDECALANKTGTKNAIFVENMYTFYVNFILLIKYMTCHIFYMIVLRVDFPNTCGVHTVESLEMLYF